MLEGVCMVRRAEDSFFRGNVEDQKMIVLVRACVESLILFRAKKDKDE